MRSLTIRATFKEDDGTELVMMFGNSYKEWWRQLVEFTYRKYGEPGRGWRPKDIQGRLLKIEKSSSPWKSYGGLKWCRAENYQEELDDEWGNNRHSREPRQYSEMKFEKSPYYFREARRRLNGDW